MLVSTLDPVWTDASDGLKKNITFLMRGIDAVRDVLTGHKLHYTLLVATVVTVGGGLIVAELERGAPGGEIASAADGLW